MFEVRKLDRYEYGKFYDVTGNIVDIKADIEGEYYVDEDDFIHNTNDEAAWIFYYPDYRTKQCEKYYTHGRKHRLNNKPANINYSYDGKIIYVEYWINGKQVTLEESIIYNNRLEMLKEL